MCVPAPSGPVQNLMVSSSNSTSVTIQWDRVECIERNSEITGYRVSYGSVVETVSMRQYTASGLVPRTEYTFQVLPVSGSVLGTVPSSQTTVTNISEGI